MAGNFEGALFNSVRILLEAPETDCVIMLGVMALLKIRPVPPNAAPDIVENHIQDTLAQLSKGFDQLKALSEKNKKPLIVATELPFALGDTESRMVHMLGKKEMTCYDSPNMAARVMSRLVEYGRYRNRFSAS